MARRKKVTMAELQMLIAQLPLSGDTTKLLEIAGAESYSPKIRLEATKAALPFCHQPKDEISSDAAD